MLCIQHVLKVNAAASLLLQAEVVEPVAAALISAVSPLLLRSCALAPLWHSNSISGVA